MKGYTLMQVFFVVAFIMIIIVFFHNRVYAPTIETYQESHAGFLAKSLAMAANGLASMDEKDKGSVVTGLGLVWNVEVLREVTGSYIKISHEKTTSKALVLANIAAGKVTGDKIKMTKLPGKELQMEAV